MTDEMLEVLWRLYAIETALKNLRCDGGLGEMLKVLEMMIEMWETAIGCINGNDCKPAEVMICGDRIEMRFRGWPDMMFKFEKDATASEIAERVRQEMRGRLPGIARDLARLLDGLSEKLRRYEFLIDVAKHNMAELKEVLVEMAEESQSSGS